MKQLKNINKINKQTTCFNECSAPAHMQQAPFTQSPSTSRATQTIMPVRIRSTPFAALPDSENNIKSEEGHPNRRTPRIEAQPTSGALIRKGPTDFPTHLQ